MIQRKTEMSMITRTTELSAAAMTDFTAPRNSDSIKTVNVNQGVTGSDPI